MSKIIASLEPTWATTPQTKQTCFELLSRHFESVTWGQFNKDFHEKEYVAVLRDGATVVGFSTMAVFPVLAPSGKQFHIAFSGDTAIEFKARNSLGFGITLSSFFREKISEHGDGNVWYVLISKGWRTYKAMEFMFHNFSPSPSRQTDAEESEVMEAFGTTRYPHRFVKEHQILRAKVGDQRLRDTSPDLFIPHTELGDFFVQRNPGFKEGDELICVARLSYSNFTERFKRCFR